MRSCLFAVLFTTCMVLARAAHAYPVTMPTNPPSTAPPYPDEASPGTFYAGTAKHWVLVYRGPWQGLPVWPEGYRQKIAW